MASATLPTHSNFRNLTGTVFDRLTVTEFAGMLFSGKVRQSHWHCVCECGKHLVVCGRDMTRKHVRSCGCLKIDKFRQFATKHGHASNFRPTAIYSVWNQMRQRCENKNHNKYPRYGGRGIRVCERWQSFENFLADVGEPPAQNLSIDRFPDNNGNYEPGNVRWATRKQQQRNLECNNIIEFGGHKRCVAEWSEIVGVSVSGINWRIKNGWTIEKALTTPSKARSR